jgi:adenine deaminase
MNNHEAIDPAGAQREAHAGLHVLHRQMPGSSDLQRTLAANLDAGLDTRAFQLCNDVAWADTIFEEGFDGVVRAAIARGLDPVQALQMATIQPAAFFRVDHEIGVVAPGRFADLLLLEDLERLTIDRVLVNGETWVERGERVRELPSPEYPAWVRETMAVTRRLSYEDLRIDAPCEEGTVTARVIDLVDGEYLSHEALLELPVRDGEVVADPGLGVNKVVLIDRLRPDGPFGVALVRGFGLREGAMASASNPMTQGVVAVGATDGDLLAAVQRVIGTGGAFVATRGGRMIAELPTPILGMTCDLPYDEARRRVGELTAAWRALGCTLATPFAYLEFVAASTEPYLRVSPRGLVRVTPDAGATFLPVVVS